MTSEMFYVSSKATRFHHFKKFLKVHKLPVASQSVNFSFYSSSSSSRSAVHCRLWLPIQSSFIPPGLQPLHANFLLSSNPLQLHQSITSVAILFSLFNPFWHSLFVLAFFQHSSFHYIHPILIQVTLSFISLYVLLLQEHKYSSQSSFQILLTPFISSKVTDQAFAPQLRMLY